MPESTSNRSTHVQSTPLKRFLPALLLACTLPHALAQMVTITAAHLSAGGQAAISNATISFTPVLSTGQVASYRIGTTGGQSTITPIAAQVTNGAFSTTIPDTTRTAPVNLCFNVTITDNVTGAQMLGPGYGCVQPTSATNSWCSAGTCNFDEYPPNLTPMLTTSSGPTGATGAQGPPGPIGGSLSYPGVTTDTANGLAVQGRLAVGGACPAGTPVGAVCAQQLTLQIPANPGYIYGDVLSVVDPNGIYLFQIDAAGNFSAFNFRQGLVYGNTPVVLSLAAAAGADSIVRCSGTSHCTLSSGYIQLVTGVQPSSIGRLIQIAYTGSPFSNPLNCSVTPAGYPDPEALPPPYVPSGIPETAVSLQLSVTTSYAKIWISANVQPAASTTYYFTYVCGS